MADTTVSVDAAYVDAVTAAKRQAEDEKARAIPQMERQWIERFGPRLIPTEWETRDACYWLGCGSPADEYEVCEFCQARLALADHVIAQLGGR